MDPERVVEIWAPADGGTGTLGSGYLIDGKLVLTAGHLLDRTAHGACEVRPLGTRSWLPARLRWRGSDCDAALLELAGGDRLERVRLGRLATTARASCRAVGFPRAQADAATEQRDTEAIAGVIEPLSAVKSGLLTVHVEGGPPQAGPAGWEGMSGAALWIGPLLVGIIAVVPRGFGAQRVAAVPTTVIAEEPGFEAALGEAPVLEAVEDVAVVAGVLADAYRPFPAQASRDDLWGRAASFLLEPEYGVVPFHGRHDELTELDGWCDGAAGLAVGLMIGPGGAGKTRLAAELCLRRRAQGALAGMLLAGAQFGELAMVSAPLLVVVDEAHSRIEEVVPLVRRLASVPPAVPVRMLLVARNAGAWWADRLPERLEDDPDARLALATAGVRELGPVDETAPERVAAFRAAVEAFGERVGRPSVEVATPDLSQPLFASILFVHLAALTALEGDAELLRGRVAREDLVGAALRREARYWRSTAEAHALPLDPPVLPRAVAVATMTSAAGETEAATALDAVPDLTGAPQHLLRHTARWLRDLYPVPHGREADSWLRPLTPELLGDALLASVLDEVPRLATELLGRIEEVKPVLATLTRAARTHPSAESALRGALGDHFDAAWRAAIEVGQEVGDPIGRVVLEVLQQQPRPDLVIDILNALPRESVSLRELTLAVASQAVFALGTRVDARDVARVHRRLSAGWADVGRDTEALSSSEVEVAMYRYLVEQTSEDAVAGLVGALNNHSVRLGAVGRTEDALAAIEEAVEVSRRVEDAEPDLLAGSLVNLVLALNPLGRWEEALRAGTEALAILRRLAQDDPEEFEPKLAVCLANVSIGMRDAGRVAEALSAIDEAVTIYDHLAERHPDTYLPYLGGALTNLSSILGTARRHEDALKTAEEAVAVYDQLADARPAAFAYELVQAIGNLGSRLADLGRRDDAVAAAEHAIQVARRLGPDADQRPLAEALAILARHLVSVHRAEDAVAAGEELVRIRRQLADERPESFARLADALDNLATALHGLERHSEGVVARNEAIEIYRQLVRSQPGTFERELAGCLSVLAHHYLESGRNEDALAAAREAVSLDRSAAREQPERFLPSHAMSLSLVSHAAGELGRREEELHAIEESVAAFRWLAARDPETYRRNLAMMLTNLAAVLGKVGRGAESVTAGAEAVELYRPLAERLEDPSLYEFILALHNHSVALRKLGWTGEADSMSDEARRFAALYEDGPGGPWQHDPALAGRFHPSYPNDLEVRFYFAEQQALEKMWVRTTAVDEEIGGYLGVLVNRPHTHGTGLTPGASVAYRVARGMPDPIWVTPAMRANLLGWSSLCERCGFDMLLLPAEEVIRRQFKLLPGMLMEAFSTRCLACGEGMVVRKRGRNP